MLTQVYSTKRGPIRVVLEANKNSLMSYTTSEANTIVRTAMQAAGDYWISAFLMKRFSGYARTVLGYRPESARWAKLKRFYNGESTPFIGMTPVGGGPAVPGWSKLNRNGEKMIIAVKGARAKAVATHGSATVTIAIPFGHAIPKNRSDAFRKVPAHEVERLAGVVGKVMASLLTASRYLPIKRDEVSFTSGSTRFSTAPTRTIRGATSQRRSGVGSFRRAG